ncbi:MULTISPECIES: ATP-binding protein [Streptomyces]|uniref:ATP-binding protein n=1 Tax=Streptomyces TaxID=1883 RepID=UPI000CD563B1|nr:ATP-binding protein [Streptomyces sp. B188M101]
MQDRYRVVTEPPWSPPSVSAKDLEGLAAALNALQAPAVAALNDLTADMVELAFNSLRPKHRQELLTSLGIRMSAPRRVSSALCRDVLTRLRRELRQHACTCGIKGLTVTVMNQVGDFVLAHDGEPVPDPVARWGATLVRATVFAWCNASVTDAHILAWAADQDWFRATADDEEAARLAAVAAAARPLVEAYPDFVLGTAEDDGLALAEESEPGAAAVADRPGTSAPASQAAAADTGTSHEETATASDCTGTEAGTAPEEACQQLESALAGARQAAEKVTDAVMDGRPPQDEDLARLAALSTVFNDVDAVFRADGIEGVPRRLEDITRAAHAHRTARERDLQAREPLRELLDVACRPDCSAAAAAAAEAVRGAARRLLDVPVWEELQREESAALAALARLIRLGRQADAATEILALQGQVVRVLPTCAMAVLIAPELTLDQPVDGDPYPAGSDEAYGTAEPADAEMTAEHETVQSPASTEVIAAQPAVEPEATTTAVPVHAPKADAGPAADSNSALPTSAHAPVQAPAAPALSPVDDTPVRAVTPAADDATDEDAVEGALVQLVLERRFGLAHHVARAVGHPEPQVAAIRLAGAAALLTSGDSQSARLTADLLQEYGGYAGQDTEGSELLLLPALLRTALITGDHAAGAQLKALVPRLPDRLGEAAAAVADRALSGALLIASPLVADVSETEARLRELRDQSRTLLSPQRLRFARATEIAKRWLAPDDGMLGSLLTTVVSDNRDALQQVREQADRLSKLSEVNSEIDRMDRKYRSSSGKPLQGSGRQDLVHLVERAVSLVKEWCLAVDGTRRGDRSDGSRAVKEISSLRQSLLDGREAALGELERLARRPDALSGAMAWAAHASTEELFALLADATVTTRSGGPVDPALVLDAELLKVCDTRDERPSPDELLTAVHRSWQEALDERLSHDAFTAARDIVELAGRGLLPASGAGEFVPPTEAEIDDRETTRRAQLRKAHDALVAELHRAQADGAVTEDQDLGLQELLADAQNSLESGDRHDLLHLRRALDTVRSGLPAFRKQAADRIRARLDALDPSVEERAQVLRRLETNDLATAADLVYFLEIGEPVPEIEGGESHLTEFFPAVPDGLPGGIDHELVELVRSGGKHPMVPVLDYGGLSTDEAALAADALGEWRALAAAERKDRLQVAPTRQVPPLLKLLGYDAKSARPLDDRSQHRREYRLFEATGVEINGRAKAPAFGSQIKEQGGNLRVMMVWGRPPAKVVMSWAERDTSGASLLVVYFGTLSREARVELAAGSDRLQPLLVVDDAALAYLAACGNRQVSAATQTLLPFSGVNPYIREKRGRIGGEMFYGRDAERKSILDPRGTQVIYGGRGLGKSALLADAGELFTEQRPGYHQTVYVNLDQENIGKGSSRGPEALWSVLLRELTVAQVLDDRSQGRGKRQETSERVRAGIRAWLDGDSRRRLLILLDECDQFFEADAPRFDQTKKLKGLGSDTKDAAKVVFAGLHSVQRFSKLASNGPFGHLAQTPKVIGPLAPQSAAELLVVPMRALGFEFKDLDLVNRVLGYCSYQPFLLQMFGHRLVELMHRKRTRRGAGQPPYEVEVTDIEIVESDAALREGISAAFKDTLSLDHRYDVIANVLAYHARHHGLEVRLSDTELREECETYWRKGFEQLDTEGFRAYLSEMVGLGILAPNHDGLGWHLRGPNALRMIGTSHEVEARLLRAEQDCELQESIVQEGRPELPDERPAPLTNTQLDDLLGERSNRTRVVLGSTATGVTDVARTLRTIAGPIDGWTLPPVGKPSVYKQELTGGRPRERRVVISDFVNYRDSVRPETCREAVDLAETLLPATPGVTRAVVIVTDPAQLTLWRSLLTGTEPTSAAPVVLRRHDHRSLRGWAQRINMFHTEDRLDRLHELTGGWPLLVDRAHRLHEELGDPEDVLRRLAGLRADRAQARAFAEATGVYEDQLLAAGYRALTDEFKDGLFDLEGAVTAVALKIDDEDEARWIVDFLDALQVFDREDTQLRLEPVLRECVALNG